MTTEKQREAMREIWDQKLQQCKPSRADAVLCTFAYKKGKEKCCVIHGEQTSACATYLDKEEKE